MSKGQHNPAAIWGWLGAGMIWLCAFSIYVYEGVGGTDSEVEYMSAAVMVGGAGILLMLLIHLRSDHQKFRLPRLSPFHRPRCALHYLRCAVFDVRFPL